MYLFFIKFILYVMNQIFLIYLFIIFYLILYQIFIKFCLKSVLEIKLKLSTLQLYRVV